LLHFFFASGSKSDYSDPVILNNNNDDNSIQDEESRHENRPFLIFDLLVPYLYSYGDVGQLARDALLLIMSVSKDDDFIAHYIAYEVIG
jgi:hypothetical protein